MGKQDIAPAAGTALRPAFQSRTFTSLQREIDRLFDDFGRGWERFAPVASPRMDVTDADGVIEITAELPGLEEKDVNIDLSDNVLTISGEKRTESERKDKDFAVSERSYGAFSRSLALPTGVDPATVKATMAKGVLKITVPRPNSSKPAKIEVKPAA
jgi:HSP20 family protein